MSNNRKYFSKFTLPDGEVYYLKDQEARELIASAGTFIVTWDGTSAPDISKIPEGVSVAYNDIIYTGTLSATDDSINLKAFYLVKTSTVINEQPKDIFDEYAVVNLNGTKTWEKLGDTTLKLSTDTSTFIKSYPGETNKLEVVNIPNVSKSTDVQIPNVTNSGTASSWSFTVDETSNTLIISGNNGTTPSLGTPITASRVVMGTNISAATGNLSSKGTGAAVMTGLGTPTVGTAITSASVATQP